MVFGRHACIIWIKIDIAGLHDLPLCLNGGYLALGGHICISLNSLSVVAVWDFRGFINVFNCFEADYRSPFYNWMSRFNNVMLTDFMFNRVLLFLGALLLL